MFIGVLKLILVIQLTLLSPSLYFLLFCIQLEYDCVEELKTNIDTEYMMQKRHSDTLYICS